MTDLAITTAAARGRINLIWRAVILGGLLFCEKFALNFFVDFNASQIATGLGADVREAQHWGFRFLVTFAAALAIFGYVKGNARLRSISSEVRQIPLRWSWLALHAALLAPLAVLSFSLYGGHGLHWPLALLVALWLLLALGSLVCLLIGLAPLPTWAAAAGSFGKLWLYAAAAAAVSSSAMQASQLLWAPTARITFQLVGHLLRPLIPTLHSDATTQILDTGRFAVQVSELCSGLEGAGLLLAFCCAWLVFFRREYYFPRALLIIPAGLALLFFLNVVRIAVLVMIGDAGYPEVAIYGFHSQAGWIAFNCTAGGIAYFSHRSPWFSPTAASAKPQVSHNPTAAYLLPLLVILAAGMLSHAASGKFETLYPLRLIAAVLALRYCWPTLRTLNWRCSWRGISAGIAVFALWMGAAHLLTRSVAMPDGLAALPPLGRTLWILARALAGVVTVPIAEELAYRGYLMRRLQGADFESLPFARVSLWALLVSSLAFGLAHGAWWVPGVAAGVVYGLLLKRTGRIGEAIAAHATTNALIAACVLFLQQWQLW
ncbi:MAG TPA: exosortase E/protease, VPEID-CTERM system [Steroidobacteraceae bacterium]|nr:exosortase E/protease, VPEID-CTERM system [Steroidobacteraceae bacterium]